MAIMSTRQAQRLGRLGGKASAVDRKGDSAWGRKAQRQRAAKAQKQPPAGREPLDADALSVDSPAHRETRVASDQSWSYRTRQTGMGGKEHRGGGVFEGHARRYHTRRQRVAPALGFTAMTAVEGLGSLDELTDGTRPSVDAATEAGIGQYWKSRFRQGGES
jgi:hypothetical protein